MAPAATREKIAQMKAQSHATQRALLWWLKEDSAGKTCRGKIISGEINTRSYYGFQIPVEMCSDRESPRGIVDVTAFDFSCSTTSCDKAWIKSSNNVISACIPPDAKVEE